MNYYFHIFWYSEKHPLPSLLLLLFFLSVPRPTLRPSTLLPLLSAHKAQRALKASIVSMFEGVWPWFLWCMLMYPSSMILNAEEEERHHVAFVFAGSVRSFVYPIVHETMRWNLINAFCPKQFCKPDIFARLSATDNTHEGFNATGRLTEGEKNVASRSKHALSRLLLTSNGRSFVEWVDIGSHKEKKEMLEQFPTSSRHKIFRTLDPRRYSMYFNRWMAYQMVLRQEKLDFLNYSWVVHGR